MNWRTNKAKGGGRESSENVIIEKGKRNDVKNQKLNKRKVITDDKMVKIYDSYPGILMVTIITQLAYGLSVMMLK